MPLSQHKVKVKNNTENCVKLAYKIYSFSIFR